MFFEILFNFKKYILLREKKKQEVVIQIISCYSRVIMIVLIWIIIILDNSCLKQVKIIFEMVFNGLNRNYFLQKQLFFFSLINLNK